MPGRSETINISKASSTTNLFYLFFHGGKAAIIPFLTLFFRLVGLSALEAGTIIAAKTVMGLIWAPLWSRCATAYNRHRLVLIFSLLMMMVTYLSFPALYTQLVKPEHCYPPFPNNNSIGGSQPPVTQQPPTASQNSSHPAVVPSGSQPTTLASTTTTGLTAGPAVVSTVTGSIQPSPAPNLENTTVTSQSSAHVDTREALYQEKTGSSLQEMAKKKRSPSSKDSSAAEESSDWSNKIKEKLYSIQSTLQKDKLLLFLVILAIVVGGEILACPVEKVADDSWFHFLNRIDDLERYGQQRFWGSLAFVVIPIIVTVTVDHTPCFLPYRIHHHLLHFYVFAILSAAALLVACCYPVPPPATGKYISKVCKSLGIICCDGQGFLFSVTLLITGVVYAAYHNFLFWRIQDLGGSETSMGLCVSIGAFSEIPLLVMSGRFVKKFGHSCMISLSLFTLSLRVLAYAFIPEPWAFLPVELTHGITHTTLWFAILSYSDFNVGAALDRSLRSVLSSFYFGIGFSTGSVLAGYIYDSYDSAVLFWGSSAVTGGWCILFSIVQKCIPKKEKVRYIKLLRNGSDNSDEEEDDWLEMALKDH